MNLSALNEAGQQVDWWFAYKAPKLHPGAGSDGAIGYEYSFMDSTMSAPARSTRLMAHDSSLAWLQVEAALSASGYILYNDERPDGLADNEGFGHCKGVLAWDDESGTGFWMIHSWPLYPALKGAIPVGDYGQTFLCLSLSFGALTQIAALMRTHHEPQVYGAKLPGPSEMSSNHPLAMLEKTITSDAASSVTQDFQTLGGMPIKIIAKNRRWNDDFWNDLVGPTLGVDIDTETWIRGPIAPTADVGGLHTTTDVKFVDAGSLGMQWVWPETADHAKWAISSDPAQPWVCVGDINRMVSQRKRGGGCVAFQNLALWHALSKAALVMAPAGMSRDDAHAHIKTTHKAA